MDEVACPRCKTTKYRNPHLKLMINVCGHSLCENCVELLFVRGSGFCPECKVGLRRNDYRVQVFEDAEVEKELDVRKKILRIFNKKEDDFNSLREYNDYLEEVETIIYNLTNGIDIEQTNRKIDNYKKENRDIISRNKSKLSKDEEYLEYLVELEKEQTEYLQSQIHEEVLAQQKEKKKNKDALIDELMFSDLPAQSILATHKREVETTSKHVAEEKARAQQKRQTHFSTGIRMGEREMFMPVPKVEEVPTYQYTQLEVNYCGPAPPDTEQLISTGYMSNIRTASSQDRGGGYEATLACQRALQDAFCGLFFTCEVTPSPVPFAAMDTSEI